MSRPPRRTAARRREGKRNEEKVGPPSAARCSRRRWVVTHRVLVKKVARAGETQVLAGGDARVGASERLRSRWRQSLISVSRSFFL